MAETSGYSGMRKRRTSGLLLNAEVGNHDNEGVMIPTPTSGEKKFTTLSEFKNKQQSFDIAVSAVEECDEEEIAFDSDEEGPEEASENRARRPTTPTPLQDFGVSVQHSEVPMTATEFLKVNPVEQDCFTDVSDAESDNEEE